jgi:hypothetical protein
MRLRGTCPWLLLVIGCSTSDPASTQTSTDAVQQCITQYAPSKGYGYADDLIGVAVPPGDAAPPPTPSSLDWAVSTCQSGGPVLIQEDSGLPAEAGAPGTDCDASRVMTREAALCVARASGLPEGLAPLQAGLHFDTEYRRIVWSVENTTSDDGNGRKGGEVLYLDAITGAVLGSGGWGQTP